MYYPQYTSLFEQTYNFEPRAWKLNYTLLFPYFEPISPTAIDHTSSTQIVDIFEPIHLLHNLYADYLCLLTSDQLSQILFQRLILPLKIIETMEVNEGPIL